MTQSRCVEVWGGARGKVRKGETEVIETDSCAHGLGLWRRSPGCLSERTTLELAEISFYHVSPRDGTQVISLSVMGWNSGHQPFYHLSVYSSVASYAFT